MCWKGEPVHLQFVQHSQFCLLRPLRLPRTPGYTWQYKQPYPWILWHTHTAKWTRKMQRTEVRQYSNESLQTRKTTRSSQDSNLTLSPTSSFKKEHHTFIYKFLPFIFLLSSRNRSDVPCMCKNSYWLYFVGSVDYICFICHVSYHLLNTQGSASVLLTVAGNTDTAKGPILSPGAPGASGMVPALISAYIGHVLFILSKCSETFNLSKDRPLFCPQGRGMELVIIKKEKKPPTAPFPLCSVRNMPNWSDSSRGKYPEPLAITRRGMNRGQLSSV